MLTPFETAAGEQHVWTTFSEDQIDLNYASPAVLLEMLDILLMYVANGARVIRLDAVAFLWKEIGTTCMNLPQTHAVVKLLRAVLERAAPQALVLTETNVPHAENISYFGGRRRGTTWSTTSASPRCYLTPTSMKTRVPWPAGWATSSHRRREPHGSIFTASHDGIGVRPLEGLLDTQRFDRLLDATRERGGAISMRRLPSGELRPYELNITWRAAMQEPGGQDPHAIRRLLASQAFMLALQGIPAAYFHSLVGSPNDDASFRASGQPRRINRRKYDLAELCDLLKDDPAQSAVFAGYQALLALRRAQPAFHPDGAQRVLSTEDPAIVLLERTSPDGQQSVLIAANFAKVSKRLGGPLQAGLQWDLISGKDLGTSPMLEPCQIVWLTERATAGERAR